MVRFKCNGRTFAVRYFVARDFGQLHPSVLELVLHLATSRVCVRGQRTRILRHRPLPLGDRHLQVARLLVDLSEMVVDRRVGVGPFVGLAEILFGQRILARLEVHPSERVEKRAVLRIKFDGLANHHERFGQPHAAIGKHVAEVVQDGWVLRVDREGLPELRLRRVVHLLTVVERPRRKYTYSFSSGFVARASAVSNSADASCHRFNRV